MCRSCSKNENEYEITRKKEAAVELKLDHMTWHKTVKQTKSTKSSCENSKFQNIATKNEDMKRFVSIVNRKDGTQRVWLSGDITMNTKHLVYVFVSVWFALVIRDSFSSILCYSLCSCWCRCCYHNFIIDFVVGAATADAVSFNLVVSRKFARWHFGW